VIEALTTLIGGLGGTILLLMPGYVLGKVYSRGVRGPELSEQIFIATTAIGGVLTHALMLWWTILLLGDLRRAIDAGSSAALVSLYPLILGWVFVVLFLLPAFLGGLAARITDTRDGRLLSIVEWFGLSTSKRTAEAWTWIWGELSRSGEGAWIKVILKDDAGAYLGAFGTNSLVSSDARIRDIYLEQKWELDEEGKPLRTNIPNRGVWISGDEISSIEFYPEPEET
jgi:hypothetical protein